MKFTLIFCFLFSYSYLVFAQQDIQRQIYKGLEACYNFNWDQADKTFKELIEKYPDDPRGYHFESSIYLWYYLGGKDKNDLDTFKTYSDDAIDKAEALLESNEQSETALYFLGANYCYRAIAFAKAGNFLDAAWATKKSESFLNRLIEINPGRNDAYLGLGLYNFAVAQIPSAFKWALNLVGISGDADTGVKYIEAAADNGNYTRVEAQYYLAQIEMDFLVDYESSAAILKRLVKKYPRNLFFNYSYAVLLMKQRKLAEADKFLNKVTGAGNEQFSQITSFSYFLKGDVNFRNNNLDSAKTYYKHFIDETDDNDYKGIAAYRLGICYEADGDRETAVKYFEKAQNGNMDLDDDIYAKRKSEIYIKRTMSPVELHLVFISNMLEAGKYKAAYDSVNSLLPVIQSGKLKAEALLYKSDAAYYMGNFQESADLASQTIALDSSNEKWVIPFSYYNIARANKKIGKTELMRQNAEKAEEENNYDYQNKLRNLLYPLMEDPARN